ncbi:MAG: hypothetical protein R3255_10095 [Candidatus Lokiarchaeia archaeon]|nr:hypothetical protein [Candidatus Lokiarchaeia archaeon]
MEILFGLSTLIWIILLVTGLVWLIQGLVKPTEKRKLIDKTFVFELLFMIIGPPLGFYRFNKFGYDAPFKDEIAWILIVLVYIVIISYWLSKYSRINRLYQLNIVSFFPLILGLIITFVTAIHFIPYMILGLMFPILGYELFSPLICLILLLREIRLSNQFQTENQIGFSSQYQRFVQLSQVNKVIIGIVFSVAFLLIYQFILSALGYPFSTLTDIYTQTHGFTFSLNYLNLSL